MSDPSFREDLSASIMTRTPTVFTPNLKNLAASSPNTATTTEAGIEPESTAIQYTTVPVLFKRNASNTKEIITVNGISSQEFAKFLKRREKREGNGRKFRVSLYTADTELLALKMPTGDHESLHLLLGVRLILRVASMGLEKDFKPVGNTTFYDENSSGNIKSGGEGDSGWKPRSRNTYPTLVVEAGWSQSLQDLRKKARFWFDISRGDVKIVLLVKSSAGSNDILIEKWKMVETAPRQGATTTRALMAMQTPRCDLEVKISRTTSHPASYMATGPLRLEFADVFLRSPVSPGEGDIILDENDLQVFAAAFWE